MSQEGPYGAANGYDPAAAPPYNPAGQAYTGTAPYGSTPPPGGNYPPATPPYDATTADPDYGAAAGTQTADNRYGNSRYDSSTSGNSAYPPAATTPPEAQYPVNAPIDNRYATGNPSAYPAAPAAAYPPRNLLRRTTSSIVREAPAITCPPHRAPRRPPATESRDRGCDRRPMTFRRPRRRQRLRW